MSFLSDEIVQKYMKQEGCYRREVCDETSASNRLDNLRYSHTRNKDSRV